MHNNFCTFKSVGELAKNRGWEGRVLITLRLRLRIGLCTIVFFYVGYTYFARLAAAKDILCSGVKIAAHYG